MNNQNLRGQLWMVAAPSGGGKTSLVEAAVSKLENVIRSISYTTREQRIGEIEGKDYFFVDKKTFEHLIANNQMLEHEAVFGNYYGTSLSFVEEHLNRGMDVILTIDWQGSRYVKQTIKDSKGIFILPPSIKALEERLTKRGRDGQEKLNRRMAEAKDQCSHYKEFDYLVINDDFEKALDEIITIITAHRHSMQRKEVAHKSLIDWLLT